MSFGLPAALWLLPLALLPLLALRRRAAARLPVATIHLWASAAASEAAPLARRIRRHWLALLQAAIVAGLALAAARPLWPWNAGVAAVVIDTSLSMSARSGGTTRMALAAQRAAAWTADLPRGTRVRLITASPAPVVAGEFPARSAELARALGALRTTDAGAPLDAALAVARAGSPPPSRLLVVTDAAAPPGHAADWAIVGTPADNVALLSLSARRAHADSRDADVLAHVWNFGAREVSTTLTLSRDGSVVARRPLTIAPRSGAVVATTLSDAAGIVNGRIEIGDALAGDNVRAAAITPPLAIRVALRGVDGFVAQALRTRPGVEIVPDTPAGRPDVVVCGGCAAADQTAPGTGLLVASVPAAAPLALAPAPLAIDAPGTLLPAAPALQGVDVVPVDGPEPATGTVVARAGRRPVIVASGASGRRVVELRIDPSRSPLVLTPAFPILIADTIDWLAGRDAAAATFEAGVPIERPLPGYALTDVRVVGPGNTAIPVAIESARLTVPPTSTSGIYEVRKGPDTTRFVVNPAAAGDSDLSAPQSATFEPAASQSEVGASAAPPADLSGYLLVAVLALAAFEWGARPGRWRSARGVAVALLVLALAGVRVPWGEASRAIVFALDTSDSMAASRGDALGSLARGTANMRRGDRAALIVFGADAGIERPLDAAPLVGTPPGTRTLGSATNLELAVRTARALLPAGGGRVVLVSDGRETAGDVRAEALAARGAGVQIDVVAPARGAASVPPAAVTRLSAPPTVHQGEPFDLAATVEGMPGASAAVVFEAAGTVLERRAVAVPPGGAITVSVTVRAARPGLSVYRAAVDVPDSLGDASGDGAGAVVAVEGEPRLLAVSDGGTPAVVPAGYRVQTIRPAALPQSASGLADFDAVVLDDVDASRLEAPQRRALAQHVEQGGGLFVLGSGRSLLPFDDADPLEAALPIDLRPRRGGRAPGLALVIVFDKSGSMDDRIDGAPKIEFARQAVQRVLASLPPTDAIGVIAFDAAATDVAELRPGHDAATLAERLGAVRPSGATAVAPALERAVAWLGAPGASSYARRLVLLVSDGRTSAADQARARAALRPGVELSAVALGDEADRTFLAELARTAGGRVFYPRRLGELPALAAREAVRVSGGRVVEERFVVQRGTHPVLAGLDSSAMPALDGYVVSVPKPGAEVALRSPLGDPILAAWRRGLGKVAVYTADLRSPWSAGLRAWPQGPALLAQTTRWVSRRVEHPFLHVDTADRNGRLHLSVDARAADGTFLSGLDVRAAGRTPAGEALDLALMPTGPGSYEGDVPLSSPGPYTFSIGAASADGRIDARAQRGVYWTAPRERAGEVDRGRLAAVAGLSGGRELAAGDDPFGGPRPRGSRDTRLLCAVAALAAFLAHVLAPRLARAPAPHAAAMAARHRTAA